MTVNAQMPIVSGLKAKSTRLLGFWLVGRSALRHAVRLVDYGERVLAGGGVEVREREVRMAGRLGDPWWLGSHHQ